MLCSSERTSVSTDFLKIVPEMHIGMKNKLLSRYDPDSARNRL